MFCIIQKIVFIFAAGNDKSHITMSEINQTINLHVSVDCVHGGYYELGEKIGKFGWSVEKKK